MANGKVITLMFHRVDDGPCGFEPKQLSKYLDYLVHNFPIVEPGQPLTERVSICLTFDDAYFDFYHHVFPLLEKHQIKAILAVPTKFITEKTQLNSAKRLSVPMHHMHDPQFMEQVPYCTWEELQEMAQSKYVIMASHGYAHTDLTLKNSNHQLEIQYSKQQLQNRLQIPIRHFVYPFGRFDRHIHQKVCEHYEYGIRIGSALNRGWDEKHRIIYRINAEKFWPRVKPFSPWLIRKISLKYWGNRLRYK